MLERDLVSSAAKFPLGTRELLAAVLEVSSGGYELVSGAAQFALGTRDLLADYDEPVLLLGNCHGAVSFC